MMLMPFPPVGPKLFWTSPKILDMGQRAEFSLKKIFWARPKLFCLGNSITEGYKQHIHAAFEAVHYGNTGCGVFKQGVQN